MPADSPPVILDARGHKCPVPTLKLRRALSGVTAPVRLEVLADDPMAQIDIPHFCLHNKLPEPEVVTEDGMSLPYWRFVIDVPVNWSPTGSADD